MDDIKIITLNVVVVEVYILNCKVLLTMNTSFTCICEHTLIGCVRVVTFRS